MNLGVRLGKEEPGRVGAQHFIKETSLSFLPALSETVPSGIWGPPKTWLPKHFKGTCKLRHHQIVHQPSVAPNYVLLLENNGKYQIKNCFQTFTRNITDTNPQQIPKTLLRSPSSSSSSSLWFPSCVLQFKRINSMGVVSCFVRPRVSEPLSTVSTSEVPVVTSRRKSWPLIHGRCTSQPMTCGPWGSYSSRSYIWSLTWFGKLWNIWHLVFGCTFQGCFHFENGWKYNLFEKLLGHLFQGWMCIECR